MQIEVFGIPNCNTVKNVLNFLKEKEVDFEFINFKKAPPTKTNLKDWKKQLGDWPVNTKGPTFRKIKDLWEEAGQNEKLELLIENSSAIKRPILVQNKKIVHIGKLSEELEELF